VDNYIIEKEENEKGQFHRIGLPAVIWKETGKQEWWLNGVPYRSNDLPTIEFPDGSKEWLNKEGKHHKENGPSVIGYGDCEGWLQNGKLHRSKGPAIERFIPNSFVKNGDKEWWKNNKRHRLNAPAAIYPNANQIQFWHFGKRIKIIYL
jgi:hypothetical protein